MPDLLLEPVELRQARRLRGGLLASAEELPEGWEEGGIAFRTIGCSEPEVLAPCEVGDPDGEVRPASAEFRPVWVRQSAACSLLSQVGTVDMAENRLVGTTEWAAGRALSTGVLSGNPALLDAEVVAGASGATAADLLAVVSCLEQAIADVAFGTAAVLHAPYRAAAYLSALNLNVDGLSPAGIPWIISPGYAPSMDPDDPTLVSIWATGPVWAGASEAYSLSDGMTGRTPDWRTNLDASWAQRLVLAAFDPCLNLAANFVVPACNGES